MNIGKIYRSKLKLGFNIILLIFVVFFLMNDMAVINANSNYDKKVFSFGAFK